MKKTLILVLLWVCSSLVLLSQKNSVEIDSINKIVQKYTLSQKLKTVVSQDAAKPNLILFNNVGGKQVITIDLNKIEVLSCITDSIFGIKFACKGNKPFIKVTMDGKKKEKWTRSVYRFENELGCLLIMTQFKQIVSSFGVRTEDCKIK